MRTQASRNVTTATNAAIANTTKTVASTSIHGSGLLDGLTGESIESIGFSPKHASYGDMGVL